MKKYDFESTKNRLIERVVAQVNENDPAYPAWKDRWESSTGLVFIEFQAATIDHLGYYLERRTIENSMNTAALKSSIYNLSAELGYTPVRKKAAAGTASLIFDSPITETQYIDAGTTLKGDYDLTTKDEFIISPGGTLVGTGDGVLTSFEITFDLGISASSLNIYEAGILVASDNGIGVIYSSDNTVNGTVDYTTGNILVTFTTAPTAGVVISADYNRKYDFTVYQGELQSYEKEIDAITSYIELPDSFLKISESYITVFVEDDSTGTVVEYTKATVGVPRARDTDRWYWFRYSFDDKLRLYFGDGFYGKNPFSDGTTITVTYLTTDGLSGNTLASFPSKFTSNAPTTAGGIVYSTGKYALTMGVLSDGLDSDSLDVTRTNAINLYASGLRAVTAFDYKYWVEATSGVSKANAWGEESVSPANIEMRNTIRFTAVDNDCMDIDNSKVYGNAIISEFIPGSTDFNKITDLRTNFSTSGIAVGDTILIARNKKTVDAVAPGGDVYSLLITNGFDEGYLTRTPYNITADATPLSEDVRTNMEDYKTITNTLVYVPPIILNIDLLVDIEVASGYSSSTVISNVESALTDLYVPSYFDFGEDVAKSYFWNTITQVTGVKTCSITWSINDEYTINNYYEVAGVDSFRKIAKLNNTDVKIKGQRTVYFSSSSSSSKSSQSSNSSSMSSSSKSSESSSSSSHSSVSSNSSSSTSSSSSSSKSSISSSSSSSVSSSSSKSSVSSSNSSSSSVSSSNSSSSSISSSKSSSSSG